MRTFQDTFRALAERRAVYRTRPLNTPLYWCVVQGKHKDEGPHIVSAIRAELACLDEYRISILSAMLSEIFLQIR